VTAHCFTNEAKCLKYVLVTQIMVKYLLDLSFTVILTGVGIFEYAQPAFSGPNDEFYQERLGEILMHD
jgi:hypothetical protein